MGTGRLAPVLRCLQQVAHQAESACLCDRQLLERFVRDGDGVAFNVLLRRHGPMVLGVCQRILRDPHAAEDAFQATFLLLVRKARTLRRPEALGPWLYGVASRTARKNRTIKLRRRLRERPLEDLPAAAVPDELAERDLRLQLDEAIRALPTKYRAPFILCQLEGLTYAQAAAQLRCPPGTLATRLARAKEQLRIRLARRGVTPPAGPLVAVAVPPELVSGTARAAAACAAGGACAGLVSASVVALTKGVGRAMLMEKLKVAVLAIVAAGMLGAGALVYRASGGEPDAGPDEGQPQPTAGPRRAADPAPAEPVEERAPPATVRTANFMVHASTRRVAQAVAEAAERARQEQALLWLGRELPTWSRPCPIRVTISSAGGRGATSFAYEEGKVGHQQMNLEGRLEQILASQLPHEITHTVWAHAFGTPVARWADEGAAILAEDQPDRQRYERLARQLLTEGAVRAVGLRSLFRVSDYPADASVLFIQGHSVTRFLVARKDHPTFFAFVRQGSRDGWDEAVRAYYGFRDVEDLEKAWLAAVREEGRARPHEQGGADGPGVPPLAGPASPPVAHAAPPSPAGEQIGPAPLTALAHTDARGGFILRQPVQYYQPVTKYARVEGEDGVTPVTLYRAVTSLQPQQYDAAQIRAFRADGQRLEARQLSSLLKQETAVLVSADGKTVHPFHLKVVKDETIVLLVPRPAPPAPPPAPTASPRDE